MKRTRVLLFALGCLLPAAVPAGAQTDEVHPGNANRTFIAPAAAPAGSNQGALPATANSNFQSMGSVASSSGPIDVTPDIPNDGGAISTTHADLYPSDPGNNFVLKRGTYGGMFSTVAPKYSMGEEITPPLVRINNTALTLAEARDYWRAQPVMPGENMPGLGIQFPLENVRVTAAPAEGSTDKRTVTVTTMPASLIVGATLLGQPITKITGNDPWTVTLAGDANEIIATANSLRPVTPATPWYYSPHAEKVYASQPGQVAIRWVLKVLPATPTVPNSTRDEDFVVSGSTMAPLRTIYWTEGSFDGPRVQITDARITTINPVYYRNVPKAVPEEVSIPGFTPLMPNLGTLYFDKFNGVGQLHAYNVEGRILIEYLGDVRVGNDTYESLGVDVVEIKRQPDVYRVAQNLGMELRPREPTVDGDELLRASPVLSNNQGGVSYYGTTVRPDGSLAYSAERETSPANDPDDGRPASSNAYNKVVIYWLEEFPDNFGIRWPAFQTRYWQRWSPNLADYAHYTVDATGSSPATGVSFPGGTLPTLVWQDDPAQAEAALDIAAQRLFVTFAPTNPDQSNRALLKFANSNDVWYVNLYTQAEHRRVQRTAQPTTGGLSVSTFDTLSGSALLAPVSNLMAAVPDASFVSTAAVDYTDNFNLSGISGPDTFSVLWEGWFDAGVDGPGDYTFGTNSDDGSVICLDLNGDGDFDDPGELIVDNNGDHAPQISTGTVSLAGGLVRIVIGFYENGGGELMNARWRKGTGVPFNSLLTIDGTSGRFFANSPSTILSLGSTVGLETGMVLSGAGIAGTVTITRILDSRRIEVSQPVGSGNLNLTFTVESDGAAPINTTATVGTRIPPAAGHELAGYISGGTNYHPAGYLNPFTIGVAAANFGAIIPVNDLPGNNLLTVRWFRKVPAPGPGFPDLYVPGKIGRYTVSYPAATTPQIVIAEGVGTGDLAPEVIAGSLYYQNDKARPGFNPNEEHAVMIGTRAYALRDDLNMIAPPQSRPFVLISYTNPADLRPDMMVYKVVREIDAGDDRVVQAGDILFDRPAIAGNLLVAPYPLPLMQLPFDANGDCQNFEVTPASGLDPRVNLAGTPAEWDSFTKKDRKGFHWIFRGPHDGTSTTKRIAMQYKYVSRPGFFLPNTSGTGSEIAEGTLLPFLRPLNAGMPEGDPVTGTPLTINFIPAWPSNAAELRVGETLALPKFGLPQVRGQMSAEVFYEQSRALATAQPSVTLHDPTREKTIQLAENGLDTGLPPSIATTSHLGKLYFQRLAPDLQERIWFDPLRSPNREMRPGTLVLTGQFKDEIAGEDYLHLNVLTDAQIAALKALCTETGAVKTNWDATIDALSTMVETFMENPQRLGTYIPDPGKSVQVGEDELTKITDEDTAVDSYAVTATGEGAGWVTMIFGNGEAFTPDGDPVQVKVFRVAPTLYTGELKTLYSKNPLDEQVTLRHTGDFAARPQDYEFEWKWAPSSATAPATYTTSWSQILGSGTNPLWAVVRNPAGALPTTAEYAAAGAALAFPRSIAIRDSASHATTGNRGLVLKSTATTSLDFTSGGVPGEIVFSATMGDLDGFVLYVNGNVALANQAPAEFTGTDALANVVPGNLLTRQFRVPRSFFTAGQNTIEISLFTEADANASSYLDFRLDVTREEDVTASTFQPVSDPGPNQKNTNVATVGGDPSLPFGGATFVLNDRWFTMRYRPKPGVTNVAGNGYSRWMPPQFVEGWIKRVLREINPFEQRVKDMFNNAISTDTSVLTQAGTRWEGDIALTLDNLESVGLIAIYETVLNRARSMSIDANTNDPDTNQALMLAAGYLSDLYTLLGHEAYADAANPTISTDDADGTTEINTSRFSFESQVASSLEEELGLLRGRDASGTRVDVAPAYNRLYWNFTGGINAGEALYATNYNIKEKAGSSTADGVVDAADAQRMFPQGHGDAYGHYLTALKGYYRLLANPNFSWQRRAEAVLVLGQAVTVDFVDERKFAGDASNLARTAQQICALTHRQQYKDGTPGWSQFRDTATAPNTTETRNWGLDEWTSRSAQGAYYHWVVGNAMLPDVDTYHTGVEKIDRTTVPELNELATALTSFQTTADNASARLNPLGLSPGAIQFDIDSTFLEVGSTAGIGDNAVQGMGHFDQIRERAMKTLNNAAGAFQQAARMTRSLRNQENQLDDYNSLIVDQERTFRNQLIEIYGRPYEGDVGPGKTYAQGYYGPDLHQWFIVDRPNALVDTTVSDGVRFRIWKVVDREFNIPHLDGDGLIRDYDIYEENGTTVRENVEVTAYPNQFIQYSDVWLPGLGRRPETGELQAALLDAHRSFLELKDGIYNVKVLQHRFMREGNLLLETLAAHQQHLTAQDATMAAILVTMTIQETLNTVAEVAEVFAGFAELSGVKVSEALPKVVGLAVDATSAARSATQISAGAIWLAGKVVAAASRSTAGFLNVGVAGAEMGLERRLDAIGFSLEEKQMVYELENLYRDLTTQEYALAHPLAAYQAANERVASILGRGLRIQEERDAFRRRAAAVVQGYRTKDVTFRIFRNEALEQYRSLFDLASRYTYMTAKAYDYETGLLGSTEGQAFISSIVASRSLGDVRDGDVFATVSSLGDNGLAGTIAKLHADHEVAEGRLGINNPEIYSTLFSLRGENFRILDDPGQTADDEAWQQTLEQFFKANILTDSDVAALCRNVKRPDGRPVPGIIIPFSTTIQHGLNFFGLPLAAGDHAFTATNFSTKIQSLGIALPGYVGMDEYASGDPTAGTPALADPDALAATPYLYVIPTGSDYMYAPPLGNELFERSWLVEDQAIPLPFNIGASAFNNTEIFNANGTLTERPWVIRQHQSFRPVADPSILLGGLPTEFTSHRLVGRSVWNSGWKIVIPAYTLLNNEQEGLTRFARTVRDVRIFIRSYSYSGN
jgi:hypothetical protein